MTRFRIERPNQNVRLKNWAPGRVAQLKLFLSHLEGAVNSSLAAQVTQSAKRKFSTFVPIIPSSDITGEVEFRELRVNFTPPRGLKNLLFYEYQLSESIQFFQFESFQSPEEVFVFSDLEDASSYFFRIRVVTKNGLVGPWSDILQADTPEAKSQGTFDVTETINSSVTSTSFVDLFSKDYTAIGGDAYYAIEYEMNALASPVDVVSSLHWADIEFRWEVDGDQVGQDMLVTVYSGIDNTGAGGALTGELEAIVDWAPSGTLNFPGNYLTVPGPFELRRRGSLIQKFSVLSEGDHTIKLRGRIRDPKTHPTPNDYQFSLNTVVDYSKGAEIKLKNFNLFEVVVDV